MQALEILAKKKENRKKVKDPKEYLEEMYADNIDYIQKLKELQAKVNTIGEIEEINKERLKKLAGISNEKVSQFFKKLGGKKNDSDEFLDHFWGIDGVNSFHDWYCVLSSCLRGVEAYKGK
jgi:predicted nuclease with TOPRIM domain